MSEQQQVVQALHSLFGSTDPASTKQADEQLKAWQQTSGAWKISDSILREATLQREIFYFAAQTLRTKIQYDFYELPADHHRPLLESLMQHVLRFRDAENAPVLTQLCLGVADLAIQMDRDWPNPVEYLLEQFRGAPQNFAALLEIIQYLPEECGNDRLMCDRAKRSSCAQSLRKAEMTVTEFLVQIDCPNNQAKKKVLDCFYAWLRFTDINAEALARNHLLMSCFDEKVLKDDQFSEVATDIIVQVLRLTSGDLRLYDAVVHRVMPRVVQLKSNFDNPATLQDEDVMTTLARIFTECGECYLKTLVDNNHDQGVQDILRILMMCTNSHIIDVSGMTLEFWHQLSEHIYHHPEMDTKCEQFRGIFMQLLEIVIVRVAIPNDSNPFELDDDFLDHRARMLGLAEDCLAVLTSNGALESVLASLHRSAGSANSGPITQEAHFYVLCRVGRLANVSADCGIWELIGMLPRLINQPIGEQTLPNLQLMYCKKTAIDLIGDLTKWIKEKPELMRGSLDMLSGILVPQTPPASPAAHELINSAAVSFKSLVMGSRKVVTDMVPALCELYQKTLPTLPAKYHVLVLEGITNTISNCRDDATFSRAINILCEPLIQGLGQKQTMQQANVVTEIYDRLTTVVRYCRVHDTRADTVANLILAHCWPAVKVTLVEHAGDARLVEKCCRLLKHSMRSVPEHFKKLVEELAHVLVTMFKQHQHSSYLYSAEILANTYGSDADCLPVLNQLFIQLSEIALQVLSQKSHQLQEYSELIEDFYGMYERYLRYVPEIVLNAPTLMPALQLCTKAVFVVQKDSVDATFAFLEAIFYQGYPDREEHMDANLEKRMQHVRPMLQQISPHCLRSVIQVIVEVPPGYVRDVIVKWIDLPKLVFPAEWPRWIEEALSVVPQPALPPTELKNKLLPVLIERDDTCGYDVMTKQQAALHDLAYRCEQLALRNRNQKPGGN